MSKSGACSYELHSRHDDWDDLTEFTEDLGGYLTNEDRTALYSAVQALAEGRVARVRIDEARRDEFEAHMREFGVQAKAQP